MGCWIIAIDLCAILLLAVFFIVNSKFIKSKRIKKLVNLVIALAYITIRIILTVITYNSLYCDNCGAYINTDYCTQCGESHGDESK